MPEPTKAPEATLFDDRGEKAGTHTAGPTWEAKDGSRIVAVKKASFIAPGQSVARVQGTNGAKPRKITRRLVRKIS